MINDLIEQLSALEHDQWENWAKSILKTENISEERRKRWETMFVPYDQLPDEIKEYDREYARKVIELVNEHLFCNWKPNRDIG